MTYFQAVDIKQGYNLGSEFDAEINGTWGPAADIKVDEKAGASALTTAQKVKAANCYVGYLYFKYLGQLERANAELEAFNEIFEEVLISLTSSQDRQSYTTAYRSSPMADE